MNEHEITDALRIQAVGAGAPTLTLDDVRGRARSIRRRRAAVATGGAATVVAAAVLPLALLLGGGSDTDSLPPADATPTVSDTANPVEPDPVGRVDQRGTWVDGDTIHPAEGAPFTPEVDGEVATVIGLQDGRWVLGAYPGGRSYAVVVTDSTGAVLVTYDALDSGVSSDDAGGAVAWFDPDGEPRVLSSEGDEPFVLPADIESKRSAPAVLAVLPGCAPGDCALLVEVYDDSEDGSTQYSVDQTGEVGSLDRLGLLSITDVSPDGALVAGHVSVDEFGQEYCSGVVVFATGEELWRSCDTGSYRFSPDGTMVLALAAYTDGFGHSSVDVLDALEGTRLGGYEGGTIFDETWGSPGTYLVSVQTDAGENLLLEVDPGARPGAQPEVVARGGVTPGEPSPLRLTGS